MKSKSAGLYRAEGFGNIKGQCSISVERDEGGR